VLYVFAVVMMGTTLPTPVYPAYQAEFGFGGLTTTVIFAVYAAGVVLALLTVGRLSQTVGRRPLLLAGIVLSLASAALFWIGTDVPLLFVGRVLSGFSAGILTSTGTIAVLEAAPRGRERLASALATAANIGGLGLGMLAAGLLSSFTPWPTRAPFAAQAGLAVVAALAMLAVRETVAVDRSAGFRLQRPDVPREARGVFVPASIGAVAGFAVCGLFSSVAPNFIGSVLDIHSAAVVGTVTSSLFFASAIAQIALSRLGIRPGSRLGYVLLVVGMLGLIAALPLASLPLLLLAAVVAGAGQGLLFTFGLRAVTAATPAPRRSEATSAYFVVAYVAIAVPAVGAGLAASVWGLAPTGIGFSVLVIAAALLGLGRVRSLETG
jgi:MFS family permease